MPSDRRIKTSSHSRSQCERQDRKGRRSDTALNTRCAPPPGFVEDSRVAPSKDDEPSTSSLCRGKKSHGTTPKAGLNDRPFDPEQCTVGFDPLHVHRNQNGFCRKHSSGYRNEAGAEMFKKSIQHIGKQEPRRDEKARNEGSYTTVFWGKKRADLGSPCDDNAAGSSCDSDSDAMDDCNAEITRLCCIENNSWLANLRTSRDRPSNGTRKPGNLDSFRGNSSFLNSAFEETSPSISDSPLEDGTFSEFSGSRDASGLAEATGGGEQAKQGQSGCDAKVWDGGVEPSKLNPSGCVEHWPKAGLLLGNEAQQDELMALTSIYEDDVLVIDEVKPGGKFYVHLQLPKPYFIKYHLRDGSEKEISVEYLPPLELAFLLPPDYPKSAPPTYELLCKWLSRFQLDKVRRKLDRLWDKNQGQEILFIWIDFLTNDMLVYLGEMSHLDVTRLVNRGRHQASAKGAKEMPNCVPTIAEGNELIHYLRRYDEQRKCEHFDNKWFTCKVCFSEKQGRFCMAFSKCHHVYCCECLAQYFSVKILDGNVNSLLCPEEGCSSQALPNEVRRLVGEELFARYDKLLLQATLNSMSDVIYCPRVSCQCAVVVEAESTMAICPSCTYVFCIFCKMAYHGVAPCSFKEDEKRQIVQNYLKGDSELKRLLEKRYGRLTVKRLVDEVMSEAWMHSNSKKCPRCQSSIEKSEGCNKMVCWRCNTVFCWLCLTRLKESNPYLHFNNPASPCFNQLFHGALPDDEDGFQVIEGFDLDEVVDLNDEGFDYI